jgi:tetratricopeptide (TPR) repeat protein
MVKNTIRPVILRYCNKGIVSALAVLCCGVITAQIDSRENKKLLFKADNKYDVGDYPHAFPIYKQLLPLDSTNQELNYKLGVCQFEDKKNRELSKTYFEKVDPAKYPETYFYLGKLFHAEGKFDKAIENYHAYVHHYEGENEHTIKEVEDLVEKSYFAMMQAKVANPDIAIQNMGSIVNTEYAEYAPLLPSEENKLYFTSRRKNTMWTNDVDALNNYYEDIYFSERKNGEWQAPQPMDTMVNTWWHDAGTGISSDGERLLIYHTSEDHLHGHIYETALVDGKWTKPETIHAHINSPHYNETSACYSPDGEMIFFSSDRPGGFGGKDIYSVKKAPNGKWAMPMNLGPTINTEYNEDAPFVHPHDSILFFSSEGHQNMGGYDIFKSSYDEVEHFSSPMNLGTPVNTVDDDIFFVLNASGSTGYMSSRREGGFGAYDLYAVNFAINNLPMNVYDIKVMDESNSQLKKVEIRLTDEGKKELYGEFRSNPRSGKCIVISKPGRTYRVVVEAQGYEPLVMDEYTLTDNLELTFKLVKK